MAPRTPYTCAAPVIPTYGNSGIADDYEDIRAHGKDERISATALFEAREFMYRLIELLD